jgi:hypothetical protein
MSSNKSTKVDKVKIEEPRRKRGRPSNSGKKQKDVQSVHSESDNEQELVLDLPTFDDDSSDKNMFTMRDDSDSDKKKNIAPLSESRNKYVNFGEMDSTDSRNIDIDELVAELRKKDKIITSLEEKIKNLQSSGGQGNVIQLTKTNKKVLMDMKLINIRNNKTIVVEKTNIACWWCTNNFENMPCFIPDRYFDGIYYVFGCFCSFSCASAYNVDLNDYRTGIRGGLIKKMYNTIFSNDNIELDVPIAPKREQMKKFIGPDGLSYDDFVNPAVICSKEFKMMIPPVIPLLSYLEVIPRDNNIFQSSDESKREEEVPKKVAKKPVKSKQK